MSRTVCSSLVLVVGLIRFPVFYPDTCSHPGRTIQAQYLSAMAYDRNSRNGLQCNGVNYTRYTSCRARLILSIVTIEAWKVYREAAAATEARRRFWPRFHMFTTLSQKCILTRALPCRGGNDAEESLEQSHF